MKKLGEMPQVSLNGILTKDQLKALEEVMKDLRKKGFEPIDPQFVKVLKIMLNEWKDDLEKKGVFPDYLAYLIVYMASQGERS